MSFWELVICGVVALIVLGPERLPGAIRSVSQFINGIKQFGHQMKAELGDELRAHELHQKLKDAEEKGLLNLTAAELAAIAELRQAAADVNAPYSPSVEPTVPVARTEVVAEPQALPAPVVTTLSHEVQHEKPTQSQ